MITFTLPVPPNRANDHRNHWKVYKDKQAYYKDCSFLIKSQSNIELEYHLYGGLMMDPPKLLSKTKIEFPFEYVQWEASMDVSRYMDADNLVARLKWPLDCLIHAGIIQSDDWLHCRPKSFPTQILKPKKLDKRELRITLYPRGPFE